MDKLNMTEYLNLAGRTAAEPDGEIRRDTFPTDANLMHHMVHQIANGNNADLLKRNIFYKEPVVKLNDRAARHAGNAQLLFEELEDIDNRQAPNKLTKDQINVMHAALGLMSEAAEILEAVVKSFIEGRPMDFVNLEEEFGDTQWYQALGLRTIGSNFERAGVKNINKLSVRYPEKFQSEDALNRDEVAERKVLEA